MESPTPRLGNFTTLTIRANDEYCNLVVLVLILIRCLCHCLITFILQVVLGVINSGRSFEKGTMSRSRVVKRQGDPIVKLERSTSCPPILMRQLFMHLRQPMTTSHLKEIAERDYDLPQEPQTDYGRGGYMPVFLGQQVGPDTIIRKLGYGHFSTVWLCQNEKTKELSAVKIMKSRESFTAAAAAEVDMLHFIKHKNPEHPGYKFLIEYKCNYFHRAGIDTHSCIAFEVMGPNLLRLLQLSNNMGIELGAVRSIIKQVLQGLVYLHEECCILHTDIKPENVLIKVNDSYTAAMINRVMAFQKLGVIMPKSYVSAPEYRCQIGMHGTLQRSNKFTMETKPRQRNVSARDSEQTIKTAKEQDNHKFKPLYVDSRIEVKIADLGNGCSSHQNDHTMIQTLQYRALEVLIGARHNFPADIWSVGCLCFELATGDYLFNPTTTPRYNIVTDHLALIWELMGTIPAYLLTTATETSTYFTKSGELRFIPPKELNIWKLEDVLISKYQWKRVKAIMFAEFVQQLIELDQELRPSASAALELRWMDETVDEVEEEPSPAAAASTAPADDAVARPSTEVTAGTSTGACTEASTRSSTLSSTGPGTRSPTPGPSTAPP